MTEVGFTHVDPSRDTSSREGDYLECGKVWLSENINLKIWTPRKVLDQVRGIVDQLLILGAHLLVDDRDETYMAFIILTARVRESTRLPSHSARLPYGST